MTVEIRNDEDLKQNITTVNDQKINENDLKQSISTVNGEKTNAAKLKQDIATVNIRMSNDEVNQSITVVNVEKRNDDDLKQTFVINLRIIDNSIVPVESNKVKEYPQECNYCKKGERENK